MKKLLSRLFARKSSSESAAPLAAEGLAQLRTTFKARYHHFKLLLNANTETHEGIVGLEQALNGDRPFGMPSIRASCTRISTSVYKMIKHLNELGGGKYTALYEPFRQVQARINAHITFQPQRVEGPLILDMADVNVGTADLTGAKMGNLGEMGSQLGLTVPLGFVITAKAYWDFMDANDLPEEIDRRVQIADTDQPDKLHALSSALQQLIIQAEVPEALRAEIARHVDLLLERAGETPRLCLRSSALGEDSPGTSYAGQYRSILNVAAEDVIETYKEIVASKYSLQALSYRLTKGIPDQDVAMCVGCLVMVDSAAGGVAYSRDPLQLRSETVVINGSCGLPKVVVDGTDPVDAFTLSREEPPRIVASTIPTKLTRYVCLPGGGLRREELTAEEANAPCMSEVQVVELAREAMRIEEHFGRPQDIEWALDREGRLHFLQSRPLLQVAGQARTAGEQAAAVAGLEELGRGVTASPGVASGLVRVVRRDADLVDFPRGAVLVLSQPLPRWAALLSRAVAVVAEQGGIAGHLANVAREFGLPAIFGMKDATSRLANGQEVTVDADVGTVFAGRVESAKAFAARPHPMADKPIYGVLKAVCEHIVPLRLMDPEAASFTPGNCKSFHDITRYCHEKAVLEMFGFGQTAPFPEHASLQLLCDVPMQFWIIDLDDGLCKLEEKNRYVKLEQIVSTPMLALWRGMVAIPWAGPPPVSTRGFMSVLMEATTNPELDPSMPSAYANRNYFMISRHFVSLQSRFGFHFSIVEALVGDRPVENYVHFKFQGGAANQERRMGRTRLISELLEDWGFRITVNLDQLSARMEGHDQAFLEERLRVLGYMVIHTRQLDMVMTDPGHFARHKEKMRADLVRVAAGTGAAC